ncbi:MAG: hypothetical protein V8Q27_08685 [Eubacteriales bacterium]
MEEYENTEEKGCTDALIAAVNCCTILSWERLRCGSCRSSFAVDSIKREKDAEQDLYEIQAFRCPQCGGEIYTNDHTIAAFAATAARLRYCSSGRSRSKCLSGFFHLPWTSQTAGSGSGIL